MPAKSKEPISVLRWMGVLFVMAIPCVGLVMTIAWAISASRESLRNYCRAHLIFLCLLLALWLTVTALGVVPPFRQQLKAYLDGDQPTAPAKKHPSDPPRSSQQLNAE